MFAKPRPLQPLTRAAAAARKLPSADCGEPGLEPPGSDSFKAEACSAQPFTPEIGHGRVCDPSSAGDGAAERDPGPAREPRNADALCNPGGNGSPRAPLQRSEPSLCGAQKPPEDKGRCQVPSGTPPRGQCLLHNWTEERATHDLDQVPSMQDGSECYYFRNGHQGLLTLQAPAPLSTTQRDSYQHPRQLAPPTKGKREAMIEILLYRQIWKEVQAEKEPSRALCEVESVTHRDYKRELVRAGPPAPTKLHDFRQEQPETFWLQRASQLPGVSYIKTQDTPFRKNCSFSTPVPLSLGQPLPYESEDCS